MRCLFEACQYECFGRWLFFTLCRYILSCALFCFLKYFSSAFWCFRVALRVARVSGYTGLTGYGGLSGYAGLFFCAPAGMENAEQHRARQKMAASCFIES